MAIEQAALVLALSIAKERELSEVEGRVRGEFLEDLLHATYGDESAAQRRARHLGYPLHGSHVVMLVDIDDFRGFTRARQISEDAIQALKRDFLRRVTAVVRASYPRALVHGRSDQVISLFPLGTEGGDQQARSQALGIAGPAGDRRMEAGFHGVGRLQRPGGGARRGGGRAARGQRGDGVAGPVQALGPGGCRAGAGPHRPARRRLGRAPGRLQPPPPRPADRARPAREGQPGADPQGVPRDGRAAAGRAAPSIHPNTLRYRLDRIREISGVDLEDPETRLNLSVALRVQALLGL